LLDQKIYGGKKITRKDLLKAAVDSESDEIDEDDDDDESMEDDD
jgi:hypothetical protein